jgi:hypothetical protein
MSPLVRRFVGQTWDQRSRLALPNGRASDTNSNSSLAGEVLRKAAAACRAAAKECRPHRQRI